jgi:hypothetical protein
MVIEPVEVPLTGTKVTNSAARMPPLTGANHILVRRAVVFIAGIVCSVLVSELIPQV